MQAGRYSALFITVVALFISSLIAANIVAVKLISVWGLIVPAGVIVFPLSYIVGDVLTEVYGYREARRVIWLGFASNLLLILGQWLVKLAYETLATPLSYVVVNYLKRREGTDTFDRNISFNPLAVSR